LDVRKFMSPKHETVLSSLHCWSYCTPRGQPSLAGKSLLDRCESGQTRVFVWVPRIGRSYLFFRRLFLPALTLATADCSAPLVPYAYMGKKQRSAYSLMEPHVVRALASVFFVY